MSGQYEKLDIKTWAAEDRPREKWLKFGRNYISDAELLAILLGSGSREETAVGLSQRLLKASANDLHTLAKLSHSELKAFKGVGEVKALTIAAAFELGRRREKAAHQEVQIIQTSFQAYQKLKIYFSGLQHEEFWVIYLNRRLALINIETFSRGGINGTVLDSRLIFRRALELHATCFIIAHNHPSGNLRPSQSDLELTKRIVDCGILMDIHLQDHLIITDTNYYSFRDSGDIPN